MSKSPELLFIFHVFTRKLRLIVNQLILLEVLPSSVRLTEVASNLNFFGIFLEVSEVRIEHIPS